MISFSLSMLLRLSSGEAFILARASTWQGVATTPMLWTSLPDSRLNAATVGAATKFDPAESRTRAVLSVRVLLGSMFSSLVVSTAESISPSSRAKQMRAVTVPPYWAFDLMPSSPARAIAISCTVPSSSAA